MKKKVLAIRHVKVEDLGIFEEILKNQNFSIKYLDTPEGETLKEPVESYQLVFVLGGYMGAYEEEKYPFLKYEFQLMENILKKDIPLVGICLGAQMLAKVLGARVYPGEKGKEMGWMKVFKTGDHFYFEEFPEELTVLQWHGDTFDLPEGAIRIFSSEKYQNQAFVYKNAIGLQFHLEVDDEIVKNWIEYYKDELKKEDINLERFFKVEKEEIELLEKISEKLIKKLVKNQEKK